MKKLLSILLLLLTLTILFSCNNDTPIDQPSESAPTESDEPTSSFTDIEGKTILSGENRFRIVYASGYKKAALKIQDKLIALDPLSSTAIGYYQLVSDSSAASDGAREILVGITSRSESSECAEKLPSYLAYAIHVLDNGKIAIVANTPDKLEEAVEKFISLIESHKINGETYIVYSGEPVFVQEYDGFESISFGNIPASEFSIVLSKNATDDDKRIANEIVSWLQNSLGVTLKITSDDLPALTDNEILIGAATREGSGDIPELLDASHYCLRMSNGDLVISAIGRKGYVRAFSELKQQIYENQNNLKDGIDIMNTESSRSLDGKNILFAGNSFVYYGYCIIEGNQKSLDYGYLYEICKANGDNVNIYDYVWGGKDLAWIYENHLSLADKEFLNSIDIVFLSEAGNNNADLVGDVEKIKALFPSTTEVYYMSHAYVHQANTTNILSSLPTLVERGIPVGDWGAIAYDVWTGKVTFPESELSYNKETFIKNNGDQYHQNMLSGYLTAQMAYCLATGTSAVGQDYSFCCNTSVNPKFDVEAYISNHYTPGSTNMDKVFASPYDMLELQKLIDAYIDKYNYS